MKESLRQQFERLALRLDEIEAMLEQLRSDGVCGVRGGHCRRRHGRDEDVLRVNPAHRVRHDAGERQIADAKTAIVGTGGGTPSSVIILQRPPRIRTELARRHHDNHRRRQIGRAHV